MLKKKKNNNKNKKCTENYYINLNYFFKSYINYQGYEYNI